MMPEKFAGLLKAKANETWRRRVIYFNMSEQRGIYLIILYQQSEKENIASNEIRKQV